MPDAALAVQRPAMQKIIPVNLRYYAIKPSLNMSLILSWINFMWIIASMLTHGIC